MNTDDLPAGGAATPGHGHGSLLKLTPALMLALLSGAAALAHQTLWTRRLVDLLGASAETFSKVVGAFFLGLALGAWIASRNSGSGRRAWRRVAAAEFIVALLALPPLFAPALGEFLFQTSIPAGLLKLFLPILLVAPPAIAMGLVLPWMLQAVARNRGDSPGVPVGLYALNTFGGLCGIGAVLLAPIPSIGLTRTGLIVCLVNVLIATSALFLDAIRQKPSIHIHRTPTRTHEHVSHSTDQADGRWLAFASGFLVLSLEVLLQHQLSQVTINSLFSGGTVLALVLLSLAVSAALVPFLVKRLGQVNALGLALLFAALLWAAQPFLLAAMRPDLAILPYELTALPYSWEILKLGAVAVCPMMVASGLIFPLLLHDNSEGDARSKARRIGVLLAWNGLGGWLGTEFAQGLLVPAFGLWTSAVILAMGYLALWLTTGCGLAIGAVRTPRPTTVMKIPATFAFAAILGASAWFVRNLPQTTLAPGERLAAVKVGREGVVATVECAPDDWRMLFNNSYTLGGSKAQFNQERQGLLPLLLHGNPKSVATLGVATGSTTAGAALLPLVERIDAIELSPLVLQFAQQFFAPFNRGVFGDPRARFIQEDARWVIAREREAYDVVIGDLFLPWRTGEGRLFTREHFQNVRRSLKTGGLYCQWLPLFQLTRPQFDTIVRTFREVFPEAFLVRGDFYCELPVLGIVGGMTFEELDWKQVASNCAALRDTGKSADPLVRHAEGIAMLMLGPLPDPGSGPLNTLANAWLEWDAARNILGMCTPWFIGIPSAEYARDLQRASQKLLPPEFHVAHDAGQFFLTLDVAAKLNLPVLDDLKAQIPERLPAELRNDSAANWQQWPMRVKPSPPISPGGGQ